MFDTKINSIRLTVTPANHNLPADLVAKLPEGTHVVCCPCHKPGFFRKADKLMHDAQDLRAIMHRNMGNGVSSFTFKVEGGKLVSWVR